MEPLTDEDRAVIRMCIHLDLHTMEHTDDQQQREDAAKRIVLYGSLLKNETAT